MMRRRALACLTCLFVVGNAHVVEAKRSRLGGFVGAAWSKVRDPFVVTAHKRFGYKPKQLYRGVHGPIVFLPEKHQDKIGRWAKGKYGWDGRMKNFGVDAGRYAVQNARPSTRAEVALLQVLLHAAERIVKPNNFNIDSREAKGWAVNNTFSPLGMYARKLARSRLSWAQEMLATFDGMGFVLTLPRSMETSFRTDTGWDGTKRITRGIETKVSPKYLLTSNGLSTIHRVRYDGKWRGPTDKRWKPAQRFAQRFVEYLLDAPKETTTEQLLSKMREMHAQSFGNSD